MKKTILLATSLLLLTACSQQKQQPVDITDQLQKSDNTQVSDATLAKMKDIKKYSSEKPAVSFAYPSSWEVTKNSSDNTITITSPKREDINYRVNVTIPDKSFHDELKKIKDAGTEIKENYPTDARKYLTQEYSAEGGLHYLINVDNNDIEVDSEKYLDQKLKEELDIILQTISFKSRKPYNSEIDDAIRAKKTGIEKFSSEELHLSFNYPANWAVKTNSDKNSITIKSSKGDGVRPIAVYLPYKSFEEEEKYVGEESRLRLLGNFSPTDSKKYIAKEYGAEDGSYYIVKVDKIYVRVDDTPDQKQKEELDIILNSLSSL